MTVAFFVCKIRFHSYFLLRFFVRLVLCDDMKLDTRYVHTYVTSLGEIFPGS
jgi:hypothetical protein